MPLTADPNLALGCTESLLSLLSEHPKATGDAVFQFSHDHHHSVEEEWHGGAGVQRVRALLQGSRRGQTRPPQEGQHPDQEAEVHQDGGRRLPGRRLALLLLQLQLDVPKPDELARVPALLHVLRVADVLDVLQLLLVTVPGPVLAHHGARPRHPAIPSIILLLVEYKIVYPLHFVL